MPYILSKRSDFDPGTLYIQDLNPNTSQMNVRQRYGQTGYERDPNTTAPTTQNVAGTITLTNNAEGLAAWQLVNVSSGSGVAATGTITTVTKANLLDGETIVITDGTTSKTFEFACTAGVEVSPDNVEIDVIAAVTANDVRDAIILAVNGESLYNITATSGGAATVTLTNTDENISAAARNVAITDTVAFAGTQSTGSITITANPLTNAGAGDLFTIGGQNLTAAGGPRTPGANDFDGTLGSPALIAADMVAAINDAANAFRAAIVTAVDGGGGVVNLTAVPAGVAGDAVTLAKTLAVPGEGLISGANLAGGVDGFAVVGMANATASTALTAVQAVANTTAVIALMNYDAVGAATAMNLAAINGAMVTGTITEAQVSDMLDILAGRLYSVPAATQIQTGGAWAPVGSHAFDDTNGPVRRFYNTGAFRISWEEGVLFQLRQNTYSFGGTVMAAVAVYNDDGSLYT